MFHWDVPHALEEELEPEGFLNPEIVEYFTAYAKILFERYGDRVKNWITFNEPFCFTNASYSDGIHAPGRSSDRSRSHKGDSSREPYVVAHHILLAHAAAVFLYREKYQEQHQGQIGITLDMEWCEPMTEREEDVAAAQRRLEFHVG
eukprot:TRINITY_DN9635_c0_g1_i1.p1 TRINITY_DN9635_c0_g1~~TRINITY_DN9635_c0_g1_i1.p1  ORF type:complete len:147 (-),score=34.01 TRINITY_DN9635_c0_g1_i1:11-451(-)